MADAAQAPAAEPVSILVAGNRLTLLPEGPERLEALIALIEEARCDLRILYYIFMDDRSGHRVRDALIAASEKGVAVSLLVDGFGSTANREFWAPVIESKIDFCRFSPKFGRRYLLRNHQKLALADGRRVITGGFNVGDDYFGSVESGAWRDLGIQVEGDSVQCLTGYFDRLFAWTRGTKTTIRELRRVLRQHSITDGTLHWLFGGPTRRLSPWAQAFRSDMLNATRLDMIAAYFAPSPGMLRRLGRVARRGTARLITASKSDNRATVGAARNSYWYLLKRKVRIFEYGPTKLHSKLFVVDDVVHIGSANFDMRSLFLNLEMMLRVDDAGFAAAMRRFVDGEIESSVEITLESHRKARTPFARLKWWLAYLVVAVADYRITRRLNFAGEKTPR
jgi:cardiolipin synthase